MDCVNCECTVKTMNNLEGAINALLQRGKHVNRMMDKEKQIGQRKKQEEVAELKKCLTKKKKTCVFDPPSPAKLSRSSSSSSSSGSSEEEEDEMPAAARSASPCHGKGKNKRIIYNKYLGGAEVIDFDIPSLNYESSNETQPVYTTASLSIPKKTCSDSVYFKTETVTSQEQTVTTTTKKSKAGGGGGGGTGVLVLDNQYFVDKDGKMETLPLKVHVKQRGDGSLDLNFCFLDVSGVKIMEISMNAHEKKVQNVQVCGKDARMID